MDTVLSVENLGKSYGSFALKDVSFSLQRGRIMGFIGRNGAGKTTTLKSLLNFVHPDNGRISFFQKDFLKNEREIKKQIGYVSGGISYYTKKKLKTITAVTSSFYSTWDKDVYRHYLTMFSLDENKTPSQLSEGMKVKYALTLALSHGAKLLILDEPTSGLDPVSRDEILDIFLTLSKNGISILFSTHITSDLDKCADDITYIKKGSIIASCPISDFIGQYSVVMLDSESLAAEYKNVLVGLKQAKNGYTALIKNTDASAIPFSKSPANLEDIMIHMERGDSYENAIL